VIVLATFISPYRAGRDAARQQIGEFLEVHVDAPLDVLIARDPKGLYARALRGELKEFTGVDAPYEVPPRPDLHLHTDQETVEQSVARVIALLEAQGYLTPSAQGGEPGYAVALEAASDASPTARWQRVAGPIAPHGGVLVSRLLEGEARRAAYERAPGLPQLVLDDARRADLELIATGVASPLVGFLGRADYETVVDAMRLADGTVWSLPIVLPVARELADRLRDDREVALVDEFGELLGIMQLTERYTYDKQREAQAVYGTTDRQHPGVERLLAQGDVLVAGPVWVVRRPWSDPLALTPLETRQAFEQRGWRTVVAFQTRNPIHRAHEYLIKTALEQTDGLLLHPLVGPTKSDDIPASVREACYRVVLQHYFPPVRALLAGFPAAMRYAGPREAIFHALARKNYGCTHFIVGRDHAGVGNYYGTYDAQRMFERFRPEELGITPLKFEHAFYCRRCGGTATAKTCPCSPEHRVHLSGTEVRKRLREGAALPVEFTRPEVAEVLRAHVLAEEHLASAPGTRAVPL
jgi:sulfate adenylyltransferase/3'-phosphoadenosine 5'-phosphosulfate synthase